LTVPKGWNVIKHESGGNAEPSPEDLMAIADAVRNVAKVNPSTSDRTPEVGRRGHLRSIPNPKD
jgi:phosphoenolpyruvate carboxylase